MKITSLNQFHRVQRLLQRLRYVVYVRVWGMDLAPSVLLSLTAKLDRTYPAGVHIGEESYVAFGASILTHDMTRGLYRHTRIGSRCFIGARSIIMPGVRIGDDVIVGAGSVVTKDVQSGSAVGGNPAVVIKSGLRLQSYGRLMTSRSTGSD